MRVLVHLHTTLQKASSKGPIRELEVDLVEGATLSDLIELLKLEIDDEQTLCVVQGQLSERSKVLADQDIVHFIPAISGGGFPGNAGV